MGNDNVIIGIVFIAITIFLWAIIWSQYRLDERPLERIFFSIISGVCLCIALAAFIESPEKQVLEYLRGNIEVTYKRTYIDSNLVRIDTIIKPKKL